MTAISVERLPVGGKNEWATIGDHFRQVTRLAVGGEEEVGYPFRVLLAVIGRPETVVQAGNGDDELVCLRVGQSTVGSWEAKTREDVEKIMSSGSTVDEFSALRMAWV